MADIVDIVETIESAEAARATGIDRVVEAVMLEVVRDAAELGVLVDEDLVVQYLEEGLEGYLIEHPVDGLTPEALGEFLDIILPVLLNFSLDLLEAVLRML